LPNGRDSLIIDAKAVKSWEKLYMKALTKVAMRNRGHMLEVGFGVGLYPGLA